MSGPAKETNKFIFGQGHIEGGSMVQFYTVVLLNDKMIQVENKFPVLMITEGTFNL